jgi:hypothetical protein
MSARTAQRELISCSSIDDMAGTASTASSVRQFDKHDGLERLTGSALDEPTTVG